MSVPSTAIVEGLEWVRGDVEPFDGTASVELKPWEDIALENRVRFQDDLRSLNLPDALLGEGLEQRDVAAQAVSDSVATFWRNHRLKYWQTPPDVEHEVTLIYDSARKTALERLREWWSGRVIEIEDRTQVELRLPLFLLSAPSASGCTTEFKREGNTEDKLGWSVTIAGNGLG